VRHASSWKVGGQLIRKVGQSGYTRTPKARKKILDENTTKDCSDKQAGVISVEWRKDQRRGTKGKGLFIRLKRNSELEIPLGEC